MIVRVINQRLLNQWKALRKLSEPYSRFLFYLILFFFCFFIVDKTLSAEPIVIEKMLTDESGLEGKKFVKILSIDGGGIRGIIPALILQEIESKLKKKTHLSQCFDVMSGTSTGGIIVLLLNTPDDKGIPKYTAEDVVEFYRNLGQKVFYRSIFRNLITLNGWIGEKYSAENYADNMEKYFNNTQLKNAITEVIIPSYDISKDQTIFFKSSYAKEDSARNFYFKDIARATSSAPTYFKPAAIKDLAGKMDYTLIDGGVAVNNPSLSASIHALKVFSRYKHFLIISIGTGTNYGAAEGTLSFGEKSVMKGGKLAWAEEIVSVMFHAGNDVVNYLLQNAFVPNKIKKYYRFQVLIDPKYAALDNTSVGNIQALEGYAKELIKKHDTELNRIAEILDN